MECFRHVRGVPYKRCIWQPRRWNSPPAKVSLQESMQFMPKADGTRLRCWGSCHWWESYSVYKAGGTANCVQIISPSLEPLRSRSSLRMKFQMTPGALLGHWVKVRRDSQGYREPSHTSVHGERVNSVVYFHVVLKFIWCYDIVLEVCRRHLFLGGFQIKLCKETSECVINTMWGLGWCTVVQKAVKPTDTLTNPCVKRKHHWRVYLLKSSYIKVLNVLSVLSVLWKYCQ